MDELWRHGRTPIGQHLEAAQVIGPSGLELCEQIDHRRHEHGVSYVLSFYRLAESLCAEFRNCGLAGAECRGGEHAGEICDVEDRGGMQVGSAFGVAHPVVEVVDVSKNIPMRHHDAFWLPRCTARVNKSQNGFGVVKDFQSRVAANRKGFLVDHLLPVQLHSWDCEG